MPSLGKILLLLLVAAVTWFGYRAFKRFEAVKAKHQDDLDRLRSQALKPKGEMTECPRCHTYHAAPRACGRADCPYAA